MARVRTALSSGVPMTAYVRVAEKQIPPGQMALLLFTSRDELCAGIMEHCLDGTLERRVPENPSPNDLVLVLCRLMAQLPDDSDVYVVIEPGAYWPDMFPDMKVYRENVAE